MGTASPDDKYHASYCEIFVIGDTVDSAWSFCRKSQFVAPQNFVFQKKYVA